MDGGLNSMGACVLGKMAKYFAASYAGRHGLDALYRRVEWRAYVVG